MVLRCVYGTCNSDTRYPERLNGIKILPFPKPKTQYNRCLRWIEACGRPETKLNVHKIDRNKGVCTKHFVDVSGPTKSHPDPIPWNVSESLRERPPPKKRRQSLVDLDLKRDSLIETNIPCHNYDACTQTEEMWTPAWDMFTLSADSQRMKEELGLKDLEIKCLKEDLQSKEEKLQNMTKILSIHEEKIRFLEGQLHGINP